MSAAMMGAVALLGAVFGLDVVSFPQAMFSRPIVAATAAGACFGAPARGLMIGALLELFALETLPFGASRYPEWGSASVVAGALVSQHDGAAALGLAACAAVLTAALGGWSMVLHRTLVARWAAASHRALHAGEVRAVAGLQAAGITADFVRGALVAMLGFGAAAPAMRRLLDVGGAGLWIAHPYMVLLAGAVAGAAVWKVTHATTRAGWYLAAGLVGGSLIVAAT